MKLAPFLALLLLAPRAIAAPAAPPAAEAPAAAPHPLLGRWLNADYHFVIYSPNGTGLAEASPGRALTFYWYAIDSKHVRQSFHRDYKNASVFELVFEGQTVTMTKRDGTVVKLKRPE